ncbi:hypothetical protein [Novosphingobium sp. SG707]|uniref:hypothetical protein n=1 Tax=Novosphingobium sp. SG707 TaxID=2586996 RepID=UPI001445D6F8|nr:hypothetical protein [Novosphingobium sp. SG707]NKJ02022.1 hypothetical protein [Novosphingobium sp. SG707]
MIGTAIFALALAAANSSAGKVPSNPIAAMKAAGIMPTREVASDLCLPATADEYEALGKNGVLRLEAASLLSPELPLRRIYIVVKGLRIPLRQVAEFDKQQDAAPAKGQQQAYWRQVSYYLVPLNLVKAGAKLTVDFSGQRSGFFVSDLTLSQGSPAFARLDEYDTPGEPDDEALAGLLAREYPDDFRS